MDRFSICRLALAAVLALFGATACAERRAGVAVQVDSAGVRIVESTVSAWPEAAGWLVDSEPVFRLGNVEDDPASQFYQLLDVALLARGGVIAVDGGSSEVRRYDAGGRHLWTGGGRGEGPGEFRSPRYLGRREDGGFLVWDRSLFRLSVITEDGEVILSERRVAPDGSALIVQGLFDDGAWLVTYPRSVSPAEGAAWTDTIEVGRYDPVLQEDVRLARIPGVRWVWTGQFRLPVPFSARPLWAIVGARLAVGGGPVPEVSVHEPDGSLAARYRIARNREAVTESDIGQMIESFVELGQSGAPAAVWRAWRDRMDVPAHEPAFDRLLADGAGNLWARRFLADPLSRESPSWNVFDPAGTYLGVVSTPGGMIVTSIRDGLLAGVYRDELGVEYVSVHRVTAGTR